MKPLLAFVFTVAISSQVCAQEQDEAMELARLGFKAVDADANGELTIVEMLDYAELVFTSMDTDDSGGLTEEEFSTWGFGMSNVAEDRGLSPNYKSSIRIMYDLWDRNNDAAVTSQEHEAAILFSRSYADLNGDNLLSEQEYLDGFLFNVAVRNAVRED